MTKNARQVTNDHGPWLAARTFAPGDADAAELRHILSIPGDHGVCSVWAGVEMSGQAKVGLFDDCAELVLVPRAGMAADPVSAQVAAWIWGEGFALQGVFPGGRNAGKGWVCSASNACEGWDLFGRIGWTATSHADTRATIHARLVGHGGQPGLAAERIADACSMPPAPWYDLNLAVPPWTAFPAPIAQPARCARRWKSLWVVDAAVPNGGYRGALLRGGPWRTKVESYTPVAGHNAYGVTVPAAPNAPFYNFAAHAVGGTSFSWGSSGGGAFVTGNMLIPTDDTAYTIWNGSGGVSTIAMLFDCWWGEGQ